MPKGGFDWPEEHLGSGREYHDEKMALEARVTVREHNTAMGIGFAVILDDEVVVTCHGPNAEKMATDDANDLRGRLKMRSNINE